MRIPARVWRLLKAEVNSRLGKFGSAPRPTYDQAKDTYDDSQPTTDSENAKLAAYYRALELPYGAPLYNVKASYKRLMKKYHPDKFQNEEQRQTATELVKKLNEAHSELTKHLEQSPNT
jgi:DnaJ-domain-containing protein 1